MCVPVWEPIVSSVSRKPCCSKVFEGVSFGGSVSG